MSEIETGLVTPEATPPVEAESTTAPEATAAPESDVPTPEVTPERTFTQSEVDKIAQRERSQAFRKAERIAKAEAEAAYWKRQAEQQSAPQVQQPEGKPKVSDFQDYEAYTEALTDWKVDQKLKAVQTESAADRERRTQAERANAVNERLSKGHEEYEDFEEVALARDVPITEAMGAFITDSDIGHKVAYELGKNRTEALRISKLSPVRQVVALEQIETRLKAPPKPTTTPPPIVPNAASSPAKRDVFDFSPNDQKGWDRFFAERRKARQSR